ncbi:hypothetical protein WA026_019825 [Henosepilachna vigintioctopunctata]|uniref:Endonuclease/exonuclease/phosphatase domain-containing protein n=1 Tax=Henosepilachna vigintioctopunctata TaxID=420089 RepID=A0AAW1VB02_9CUCU
MGDIEDLLLASLPYTENLVVVGDMNIDVSRVDCTECVSYLSSLNKFGLTQIMKLPTRNNAILDQIMTNIPESLENIGVVDCHYSDHDFTSFTVAVEVSRACSSEDLAESSQNDIFFLRNIDDMVAYLSEVLMRLFNKHALMRICRITKPPVP